MPPIPCGKSYAKAADLIKELKYGRKLSDAPHKITVEFLWHQYLIYSNQTKAPLTVSHIETHIKPFLSQYQSKHITELTKSHFSDYKSFLLGKYSVSGANIKLAVVKAMFHYAYAERGWLVQNPAALVKKERPQKVGRCLTEEELREILNNASHKFSELILFALYTKLREGEIAQLKKEDIKNNFAHIVKIRKGKKLEKFIPVPSIVHSIIHKVESGPIFPGWQKDRISQEWWRVIDRLKKAGKLHGRMRFYDLRHTGATWAITKDKMRLEYLSEIMGHSSIKITKDTYGHLDKSHLMAAVEHQDYGLEKKLPHELPHTEKKNA